MILFKTEFKHLIFLTIVIIIGINSYSKMPRHFNESIPLKKKSMSGKNQISSATRVYLKNGKVLTDMSSDLFYPKGEEFAFLSVGISFVPLSFFQTEIKRGIVVEGRKIRPFETDSVIVNLLVGIPHDSAWIFKIIDGEISAYSPFPIRNCDKFSHLQKGNSKIERYSDKILENYLGIDLNDIPYKYVINQKRVKNKPEDYIKIPDIFKAISDYNSESKSTDSSWTSGLSPIEKEILQSVRVFYKNGDIVTDFCLQYFDLTRLQYEIYTDGRELFPKDADSIQINFITGIPHDTMWIFKIIDGKISAYSPFPFRETNVFCHIQKENLDIKPYSPELLETYLGKNKKARSVLYEIKSRNNKVCKPRKAIMEYNLKTTTNKEKVNSLYTLLKKERDAEIKVNVCEQILKINESEYYPYMIIGDYYLNKGKTEEAYKYYIGFTRYCLEYNRLEKTRTHLVREKIKKMGKLFIY